MENLEIILKLERNPFTKQLTPIIFFRGLDYLRNGLIDCFDGIHAGASIEYYRDCKPATIKDCESLLKHFTTLYSDKNIIIKKRLTFK